MSVIYEKAVAEDLNLGWDNQVAVTNPAGGNLTGSKIGIHSFLGKRFLNVKDFGATGDGVTDDRLAIAAAAAELPATGGILFFPAGIYITNGSNALVAITDKNSVMILGAGKDATELRQLGTGAGNAIEMTGSATTNELVNPSIRDLTLRGPGGTASTGKGIVATNWKDGLIENVNIFAFRNHSIDILGIYSLYNVIRGGRMGGATNALAAGRMINARVGNNIRIEDVYFNGTGNPSTGGSSYDTAVDVRGAGAATLIGNIYDGVQYAVQTTIPTVAIGEWFDFSSAAPTALSNCYYPTAQAALTIIAPSGGATNIGRLIYNPNNDISDRMFTVLGFNPTGGPVGQYGGHFSGTLFGSEITPAQITADQNNYLPNDATDSLMLGRYSLIWRISSDTTIRQITGIGGGAAGKLLILVNVGATAIRLINGSLSSSAANRIQTVDTGDMYLRQREHAILYYDAIASLWRVLFHNPSMGNKADVLTPAQITADQNNYAPTGAAWTHFWRLSSDAARTITGIARTNIQSTQGTAEPTGYQLTLMNVGTQNIILANESASSANENQIRTGTGANLTIATDQTVTLYYDGTSARWRVLKNA